MAIARRSDRRAWRLVTSIAGALALASCYEPHFDDCVVACASSVDCATGQQCGETGVCSAPGVDCPLTSTAEVPDAAPSSPDAGADGPSTPDAPLTACQASCPGSCEGDTCVIDCTSDGSCENLSCPSGLPCRVSCGKNACKRLDCSLASSCDITCNGKNSCEEVTCGSGRCEVACNGDKACKRGVECQSACACEVTCGGDDACRDRADCPLPICGWFDGGCRANDAVCDRCE